MQDFFKQTFGFTETTYAETQAALAKLLHTEADSSGIPGWRYNFFHIPNSADVLRPGCFRFDTVAELRMVALKLLCEHGYTAVAFKKSHLCGDSRKLHGEYPNSLFQAASQFNCLEFVGPTVTPERGITCYGYDLTQGPACAIACAAGTAFRNYFVPIAADFTMDESGSPKEFGQTKHLQLNGLSSLEKLLAPVFDDKRLWLVRNGYIELTTDGVELRSQFQNRLAHAPEFERACLDAVRVGCHFDTEVTDARGANMHPVLVSQVFASACSIGYSRHPQEIWESIAQLTLKAAYEATFYAYIIHICRQQKVCRTSGPLFLTKLGGGVFANPGAWICEAMIHAQHATRSLFAEAAQTASGRASTTDSFRFNIFITHHRKIESGYENFIST